MSLNDWIKEQEQRGVTTFSFQQIRCVFAERSEKTLKTDINRLTLSKRIQNVYKGFYVIIPTQYQLKGVVPPSYYINELMEHLGKPYYVGLLSAAAIYGASHQRAMMTQIVTTGPRPRTSNKNTLLNWNYRQQIPNELIESRNAEMGRIKYSSAELTAVDIIQFASNIGGYQGLPPFLLNWWMYLIYQKWKGFFHIPLQQQCNGWDTCWSLFYLSKTRQTNYTT